jgi:hypothetical protein
MQENGSASGNARRSSGRSCLSRCRAVGERSSDRARWCGCRRRHRIHRRQRRGDRWNDGRHEHRRGRWQRTEPCVAQLGGAQRDAGAAGPQRRESRHRRAGAGRARASTRRRSGRASPIKQRSSRLGPRPARTGTVQDAHRGRRGGTDARRRHLGGAERDADGPNRQARAHGERRCCAKRRRARSADLCRGGGAAQERNCQGDHHDVHVHEFNLL